MTTPTDLPARVEEALAAWRHARDVTDEWEEANSRRCNVFEALAADWQRVTKELESERGLHACAKAFHDVAVAERDLARYQVERLRERERVLTRLLNDAATQLDQCAVWLIEDRAQECEVERVENLAAELRAALSPEPKT